MDDDVQGEVFMATCPKHLLLEKVINFYVAVTKKVL
jgi:hypothetical protein